MKFERPLQEKEQMMLEFELYQIYRIKRKQLKFLAIWIGIALVVGTIAYFKIDPRDDSILFLTVAGYIGAGVWAVAEQRAKQSRQQKSVAYLQSKNLVTVVQVQSDIYNLLEEQKDEGVFYLFQLADNKVLSFGGQNFYESSRFPSNDFEIIEGRGIKNEILILETYIKGEKIEPTKIITGKEKWDVLKRPNYPDPAKLTIVDGRIEDYIK